MLLDVAIRGGRVVLPQGVVAADIGIEGGSIAAVGAGIGSEARETIDAVGLTVFPGVVDSHVHFNEPGRTDWEGAATGSAALVAGGGTCFCDMPLNSSPPTLDAESFKLKRAALEASSLADFALWGGLCPQNLGRMSELAECGVIGFKAFMCASGIDDFPSIDDDSLGRGMEVAARLGLPVAVHAEDERMTRELAQAAVAEKRTSVRDYLDSRPIRAEAAAVERAIALAEQTRCSLHIVHVSSGAGVRAVVQARQRGVNVTCETCPHYLVLTDEDVERIGAAAKCAPPIRSAVERESLWRSLIAGEIEFVASDHSPAPPSMKTSSDFFAVWGGISGCQTTLGLFLFQGHSLRSIPLVQISSWISASPAKRYRLENKGRIEVGADADLALVDLSQSTVLARDALHDRHRFSPYLGKRLGGAVRRTIVRGQTVFAEGKIVASSRGRFVRPASSAPTSVSRA
jgi:allantoinase